MKFNRQVITIDAQIACIDGVIDDYKTLVEFFDGDEDLEFREKTYSDLAALIATKYSLRRLQASGANATAVAVPVIGRCLNRFEHTSQGVIPGKCLNPTADCMPVQITRISKPKTMNEAWEKGLVTPGILRQLDAERTNAQTI